MDLAQLLKHPCGVCSRLVAWGAQSCRRCGARGVLVTYGPAHVGLRHWLFAVAVIVVPFIAAAYAAGHP